MAKLVRTHDWASTPLGPIEDWPKSLMTAVDIVLASGHAMQLAWGPERIVLYNDAYAPMLGERHPRALGVPFREAWPDVWDEIEPLVERVFAGETVRFEDMPLTMTRKGYPEKTWWTFSYSPVRDEFGAIAGLLNVTVDTSPKMRAEQAERERDEANARLRANEERLRALVHASSDVVYTMSPDWSELRQLDGRGFVANTETPSFQWMDNYLFPEDRGSVLAAIDKAITSKGIFELEHRVRRTDGSAGWTFSRAVPISGSGGEIVEWFGMAADVTARRGSDERQAYLLKLSDALRPLRNSTEIKNTASSVLGQQLRVNRAFYAEVEGDNWLVEGGYASGVDPLPAGVYSAKTYGHRVMDTYRAGRRIVFYDTHTDPGFSPDEREAHREIKIIGAVGVPLVKDGKLTAILTVHTRTPRQWTEDEILLVEETAERTWAAVERARAEALVLESERKYRTLFDSMEEGFCVLEVVFDADQRPVDLRFVEANPAFERNAGLFNAKGRCVSDIVPGLETRWIETYGDVALTGEPRRFEDEAKPLGRWFEVNTFRVEPAELHRVAVLFSDITERRHREEELKRTNRDLEQFAYTASHDLREPIRNVSIYAELLSARASNQFSPEMLEWLQFVRTGARRMERLVRDLLSFSQIAALPKAAEEIDANVPLQAALSNLKGAIQESRAQIVTAGLPRLVMDSICLQQLFQNLIGNAIKYRSVERLPTIEIQAERVDRGWQFSVADNGIGIEAEYRESIFGLFKRLYSEDRYPGTGIGLAICQRIVERMGGRIWVKSELGEGSTFYFWIPE